MVFRDFEYFKDCCFPELISWWGGGRAHHGAVMEKAANCSPFLSKAFAHINDTSATTDDDNERLKGGGLLVAVTDPFCTAVHQQPQDQQPWAEG